ncbi:hypothetical protein FS837_008160 [Tulasnella sp. UAMH 9824]|nr:hypothetical protein FS837_008160 [Tulasnella sp. UAMH 9824]
MSVGSKSESGSHRSTSSSTNTNRDSHSSWATWRTSQWDHIRKQVSTQRRQHRQQQHYPTPPPAAPQEPGDASYDTSLLHAVSSDVSALNKLSEHIKRLKKELLQLKQWEETRLANLQSGQPPPPPLPFLMNLSSSISTPTASDSRKSKHRRIYSADYDPRRHQPNPPRATSESPNSSDETEKQESVNEKIEEKKRQLKAAQEAERLRRREMARRVANAAERVKQDQRRRVQKLAEYERELLRKEQERIRSGESRSDGATPAESNRTNPSSASGSPFHDLHGDYFTNIPSTPTSSMPIDPAQETRFRAAWSRYAAGWARITGKLPSPPTPFTFATFPWPTVDPPNTLADLTKITISEFMLHAPTEFHLSTRVALHEAVRRWHPDRSNSVWTHEGIVAEEERPSVKKGADIVIRVLNQLSAEGKEVG